LKANRCPKRYYVGVFPVSPIVVIFYLIVYALAGMALGALSSWLASLITKCGRQGIVKDVFLGSFGYLGGFIGCIFMPWPRNTVVEQLGEVARWPQLWTHISTLSESLLWWLFSYRSCMNCIGSSEHAPT